MKHAFPRLVTIVPTAVLIVASGFGAGFDAADNAREVSYKVRPLSSFGGSNSRGNGINDWGLVSGFSTLTDDTARRGAVWFHGLKIELGTFGGTHSNVTWPGQSNSGLVVGIAQTDQPQTRADGWSCRGFFPPNDRTKYTCLGFVWERGKMTRLSTLGGDNGFAASANNHRQVVGWAETTVVDPSCTLPNQRQFLPVLWDLNTDATVALPPYDTDSSGAATAISDTGLVVGISGECDQSVGRKTAKHAVMWENGAVRDLGNVGGDTWNTPTAISTSGDIVVGFGNSPGAAPDDLRFRAWLWTERDDIACPKLPGTDICDLGTLDAGGTAEAWGVNDAGQVVGTACSPAGYCRAFLWQAGVMIDLNELKGDYSHLLLNAMDINNLGQITGRAQTDSGFEAFVATPKH